MKTILEAYHQRIETGQLTYDLAQEEAAYILNEFQSYLEQQADKRKHKIARENPFTWLSGCFSWLSLFFVASIQPKPSMKQAEKKAGKGRIEKTKRPFVLPGAYKGIYLYGPVGGGKSLLMDLLFTHLALTRKWRLHFHRFMVDIQAKRHVLAQNGTFGKEFSAKKKENKSDSIQLLAQNIGQDISVLCLDELDIRDMADAMIIGRLFKALVQEKIFLIVTSNVAPEGLYAGGVNRTRFVSFVEWLKGSMYILPLRSSKDFRLDKEQGLLPSYFLSTKGERNEGKHKLEAQFQNFTGFPLAHALPYEISILGRIIRVPRAAQGIAYFSFQELCGGVYGAADYLALAQNFHTLFLESIPCLYEQDAHPMKRLVLLIDTLYDCQVALYASAEALPEHLCQSAYSAHQQEFKRIVSRLIEIQSKTYKELCLNHPAREGRA